MFTLRDFVQPETLEEAYNTLIAKRSNTVLGGGAFLKLGSKRIGVGIDLSKLHLNYIKLEAGFFEIGAMTPLRDIETSLILQNYCNGILPKSVTNIVGVQLRNTATVGASVFAKFGFSDLITALLALDAEVELFNAGKMPLKDFLDQPFERDILIKVLLKEEQRKASYQSLRNSATDFPILNAAVSNFRDQWTIVVGARPFKAEIAQKASIELDKTDFSSQAIQKICNIAAEELGFGTNTRGTAEYRRAMCKVLIKRAITEVLQCR